MARVTGLATRTIAGVRLLVAMTALALILLPGQVWTAPAVDVQQEGFDPNLYHIEPRGRFVFEPFLVLQNGSWEACPCEPGTALTLVGHSLAPAVAQSPQGARSLAGVQVLVDGKPAEVSLVSPSQVNFLLPADVSPPTATVTLLVDGEEVARRAIGVGTAARSDPTVDISRRELQIQTLPGQEPAVHLLTTPLSFRSTFLATITEDDKSGSPLRVMLWSPRNFSAFSLVFDGGPQRQMRVVLSENRGHVTRTYDLGPYELGQPYGIEIEWRRQGEAAITVFEPRPGQAVAEGPARVRGTVRIRPSDAPSLFTAYRPSLTVTGAGNYGSSRAVLSDYRLSLLHERFTTVGSRDAKIRPLMLALAAVAGASLLVPWLRLPNWRRVTKGAAARARGLWRRRPRPGWPFVAGIGLGAAYLAFNGFLFTLGSHPFDMASQKIWAYVAVHHGLPDLYYVAQTAPLARVWDGTPFHEAVFPYNLGMAYYFWAIGHFHQFLFGHASPDAMSLEITIKAFNLAWALADAVLIYALLRRARPGSILPWVGVALFLFNPAVLFDLGIWGETEAVPLFFLLASLLAASHSRPVLAWPLLGLAFLTKQTVLVAVGVIALFYLMRFPWRQNLAGASLAVLPALFLSLPFALNGYSPSVVVDPTLAVLWVHGGGGAERAFQTVSYDGFNLWPLVTPWTAGVEGLRRLQFPEYAPLLGDDVTYRQLGQVFLGVTLLALVMWLLLRRQAVVKEPVVFLATGLALLAQLVLPTQSISRYLVFPIVFGLCALSVNSHARWLVAYVLVALSFTSLLGMYGSTALALEPFPSLAPSLAPGDNPVSALFLNLFRSDVAITVASSLNLTALLAFAVALWLTTKEAEHGKEFVTSALPAPSS